MNEVIAIVLDIDFTKSTWVQYKKYVSKRRQKLIEQFSFPEDKIRCLWSELLVQKKIYELTGISPEKQRYEASQGGKPLLCDSERFFNLSHSGEKVFACFSLEEVGVDVEKIKDAPFYIMDSVFHEEEISYVESANNPCEKKERFYEVWTCKEAYGKWSGKGILYELNQYNTRNKRFSDYFHIWIKDGYCYSVYMDVKYDVKLIHETIDGIEDFLRSR